MNMKSFFGMGAMMFFFWVSSPLMAAAAMGQGGACPANCPGCDAVMEARKKFIEREMAVQEATVLKKSLVEPLDTCDEVLGLIDTGASMTFMSPDIGAIVEGLVDQAKNQACSTMLNAAKSQISGITGLFNNATQLPYGLGNVATLSTNQGGGFAVNSKSASPNIPRF